NFSPKDEGLLARLRALKKLTEDSWTAMMVLMLDLMFMGIELGAVMAKMLGFIPMQYSRELARQEILGAVTASKELADDIRHAIAAPGPDGKTGAAKLGVRRPPPGPTAAPIGAAAQPEPNPPAAEAPTRDAPAHSKAARTRDGASAPRRRGRPPGSSW